MMMLTQRTLNTQLSAAAAQHHAKPVAPISSKPLSAGMSSKQHSVNQLARKESLCAPLHAAATEPAPPTERGLYSMINEPEQGKVRERKNEL